MTSLHPGAAPTPEENRPINKPPNKTTKGRRRVRLAALPGVPGTPLPPTPAAEARATSDARATSTMPAEPGAPAEPGTPADSGTSGAPARSGRSGASEVDARPDSGGAHRATRPHLFPTSRDAWLVLAERVVGDWAATLRAALLLVLAVAAAIMVIGIVFGIGPAVATAILALLAFLAGRHRGGSVHR
ncbi:MAG TPA: hypothetical protein VGP26_13670 [Actinophytocola sp.]|nr:hypothetical protein [Actinophytocola sp.]